MKWHTPSKYTKEMSMVSKVVRTMTHCMHTCSNCNNIQVPLGIQFYNEAKISDMCHILDALNYYVPAKKCTKAVVIEGKDYNIDDSRVFPVLLFGDQLTVARVRSSSIIRSTTDSGALDKFAGFSPAIADWHARACFLDVSNKLSISTFLVLYLFYSLFGIDFIHPIQQVTKELYFK